MAFEWKELLKGQCFEVHGATKGPLPRCDTLGEDEEGGLDPRGDGTETFLDVFSF